MEHIIAQKHGGPTVEENLALACFYCNRYKGPNVAGLDPAGGEAVRLFHPRLDDWEEHFSWNEEWLEARTAIGRVTVEVLRLNHPDALAVRRELMSSGLW